jgi:hypothetical protein
MAINKKDLHRHQHLSGPSPLIVASKSPRVYLDPHQALPPLPALFPGIIAGNQVPPPAVLVALKVLAVYHLRAGELLGLSSAALFHPDRALVEGLKGSRSFIIWLPGLSQAFQDIPPEEEPVRLFPFTHFRLWSWARKLGIHHLKPLRSHALVTHIFRHQMAQAVNDRFGAKSASDALRHRSSRSLHHYLLKKEHQNGKAS